MRMVADRHRLAADHNNHCWRAFRGYQHRWPWTTLNPSWNTHMLEAKLQSLRTCRGQMPDDEDEAEDN